MHFAGAKFFKLSHIAFVNWASPLFIYKTKNIIDDKINKKTNCEKIFFKSLLLLIIIIGINKYGKKKKKPSCINKIKGKNKKKYQFLFLL